MHHRYFVLRGTNAHARANIYITILLGAFTLFCGFGESCFGNISIGGTPVVFATVQEGQRILATRDDFVQQMGPFDRAARMKTDAEVSEKTFLGFVATNVLEWQDSDKTIVTAALEQLRLRIESLSLPLPKTVYFVKTTGNEEGGQQYTRGNAIILNARILAAGQNNTLRQCIAHELFHILSRHSPDVREKCYAAIGFQKCVEAKLPPNLISQRLTNPDAPKNDHYIELKLAGKRVDAIPIMFSRAAKYDIQKGGEFFAYVQFKFLVVAKPEGAAPPSFSEGASQLVDVEKLAGLFEQIGNNTKYIVHPEEILADNFSILVRDEEVPSPAILEKLKLALRLPHGN